MASYLGDYTTANTVYVYWNTFDSNDPSASVTLTGLALGDILIYKNGSTTERSSTAGFTLLDTDGIDFDGKTGIHGFSIDLSNNTDSGFYAAGGEYTVVVASVTVDAATVNFVAAHFSIERTGGALALLKGTNSLSDIESKIDTLTTNVATVDTVVDGIVTTLGTPAGASVSADIAAIEAQTDDIGAAGAGLTAVPWNASWDAEVQSEVADALAVFWTSPATLVDLIWDEAISGHSTAGTTGKYLTDVFSYIGGWAIGGIGVATASVNAIADQVWDEATSGHTTAGTFGKLSADVLVDTAEIGAAGAGLTAVPWNSAWAASAATAIWDAATATYGSAGSYGLLIETNLDAAVSTASAPSAATVADAVWDEVLSGHLTAGTTGEALNAAGAAGDPWTTTLPGAYTGSQAGKMLSDIITDTAEIGAAGAGLTALATAAALATVDTEVGNLQTDVTAILADTADMQPKIGTPAGVSVSADIAAIKVDTAATLVDTAELQTDWTNGGRLDLLIDAIKVVTDALPNGGALSSLATAAALATVDGNVDSILVDTDTTIPGLISTLNDLAASDILTTALVESYAADGAAPTLSQAIFLIQQFLYERATSGTTVTVKKLDGATTAATRECWYSFPWIRPVS